MPKKSTDCRIAGCTLYFLPVQTRVPMKSGPEVLTSVTCARVRMTVKGVDGKTAYGWGETPLNIQWMWPSKTLTYEDRHNAAKAFCAMLAREWAEFDSRGHAFEIGYDFQQDVLKSLLKRFNRQERAGKEPMSWLAALVCCAPFDLALHDAYGLLHRLPVYSTYTSDFMSRDLASYLTPAKGVPVRFNDMWPANFMAQPRAKLPAWHSVGGVDPITPAELTGKEPNDGYPVLLKDWIERDGLYCLKVKLRGNDAAWDFRRMVTVGEIGQAHGVKWLSADFNCMCPDVAYVTQFFDRLMLEAPKTYAMLLYAEQPFSYDIENNQVDCHAISARKPLFMDESAHEWHLVKLGRSLGWSGVALKTCKTQTGALLSLCWARAHGMTLMVQDLTNPMLAIIPHIQLAAHAGTIMGLEVNAAQFYPDASKCEEAVHPGVYRRNGGEVDLSTLKGPGFGYCLDRIKRELPAPAVELQG